MKRLLLITFAFSAFAVATFGNDKEFETRTATVRMNVTASDRINIQAKNTDLVVETWNKNEVEIVATLRFDGKMTDKMTAFLDDFQQHVEGNIRYSGSELEIDTNLDEPNKVQIGSKHVGFIIGFSDDEFRLDYKIKAPKTNEYEINNSYKDVTLLGDFGKMKLTQYSGDLTAGSIEEIELNMKYGSARFKEIKNATMEIYEQELEAEAIGELEINTKYSEIEVDEIDIMEAESYETDFVLGTIGSVEGNFKYGEMEIEQHIGKSNLEFYEMDIDANNAGSIEFKSSKYGKHNFKVINSLKFQQSYEDELTIGEIGNFSSEDSKYGNHDIEKLTGDFKLSAYEDDVDIDEVTSSTSKIEINGKYINTSLGITNQSFNLKTNIKYGKVGYDENDVEVKKYIKDGDQLEVEVLSKTNSAANPIIVKVEGYEVEVDIK